MVYTYPPLLNTEASKLDPLYPIDRPGARLYVRVGNIDDMVQELEPLRKAEE